MSRPRFLADHDLNEHIVSGVRRSEPLIEFRRAREEGLHEATDAEILAFANDQGLLVVSHDVNTMPAAAYKRIEQGQSVSGVFMAPQSAPVSNAIESLVLVWHASEAEEWEDLVVYLPIT